MNLVPGAAIIHMLTDYLGKAFFDGVVAYLEKHAYHNAANHDLLVSIAEKDNNKHPNLMVRTSSLQTKLNLTTVLSNQP